MRFLYTIAIVLYAENPILAQLHDNNWVFGYSNNADTLDEYGISVLSFSSGNISIQQNSLLSLNFNSSNAGFSDSTGILLSYTNAIHISNLDWEIMEGGKDYLDGAEVAGGIWPQIVVGLPFPGHAHQHIYVYQLEDYLPATKYCASKLFYCIVDMSLNSGHGKVIQKDIFVLQDTFPLGNITAVKHANGRDWWVLLQEINTNRYYRILISPDGANVIGNQNVGLNVLEGVGQVSFSPNGRYYASYFTISTEEGAYLNIYDFDRCSGLLSNHRQHHFIERGWGGLAFSPNSKYLYVNHDLECLQYDLQSPNLWASQKTVGIWDGYKSPSPTWYFMMQLAPDGKIYSSTITGTDVLHVIQYPDEADLSCRFEQHAIRLPTYNAHSTPNYPYFRLGPLDGSSCDTLGLDNHPVAWWRSQQDTLDPLIVNFHDLSYYEPASWHWDFGDGQSSAERHPTHVFNSQGAYNVCLIVANNNSSDTLCRTLYLGVVAQNNPDLQDQIQVFPNPCRSKFAVTLNTWLDAPEFYLYNQLGNLVCRKKASIGVTEVETSSFPKGIYFWSIFSKEELVKTGKIIKIE